MLLMKAEKMHKLPLVENINKIGPGTYELSSPKATTILGKGPLNLYDYNNKHNLNIELEDHTTLYYEKVNILTTDIYLNITVKNNCEVNFNWVIIASGQINVNLKLNILGDSNKCHVKIRAVNKNSLDNLNIVFDGSIAAHTTNNELLEDIKGLLPNNSSIKISPNMLIDTNEVIANHLVTIGSFTPEELFYLMSKGLSYNQSCELLNKSFITSIINPKFQKLIQTEVINIE